MKVHDLTELQINSGLIGNNYSQTAPKPFSSIADSDESVGNGNPWVFPERRDQDHNNSVWIQFEMQVLNVQLWWKHNIKSGMWPSDPCAYNQFC